MRARPQVEPLVAAAALALAIAGLAWWLLSDEQIAPLRQPTYKGAPVQIITASLPAIGDFEREYNVNDENPFVPLLQRVAESRKIRLNRTTKPTPTSKPVEVVEVPIPQLTFPAASARRENAPDCVGIVASAQGETLLVRMPGSNDTLPIAVGDAVPKDGKADQQWTLVSLEPGGVARFRDPGGAEQLFMIGSLALTPPASAPQPQQPGPPQPRPQQQSPPQNPQNPKPPGGHHRPGAQPAPPGAQPRPVPPANDRPQGWSPRPQQDFPPPPPLK